MGKKRNTNPVFTNRLKSLMEDKGVSIAELAKVCDISRQSILNYVSEESMPNINVCKDIAAYFNVSCDYLIGKDDQLQTTDEAMFNEYGLTSTTLKKLRSLRETAEDDDEAALLLYVLNRLLQEEDFEGSEGVFQEITRFISRPTVQTFYITGDMLNKFATNAALGTLTPEALQSIRVTNAISTDDLDTMHLFPVQQSLKTFAGVYRAKYQTQEKASNLEYRTTPNRDGFYYDEDTECYCKDGKWFYLTPDGYVPLSTAPNPVKRYEE